MLTPEELGLTPAGLANRFGAPQLQQFLLQPSVDRGALSLWVEYSPENQTAAALRLARADWNSNRPLGESLTIEANALLEQILPGVTSQGVVNISPSRWYNTILETRTHQAATLRREYWQGGPLNMTLATLEIHTPKLVDEALRAVVERASPVYREFHAPNNLAVGIHSDANGSVFSLRVQGRRPLLTEALAPATPIQAAATDDLTNELFPISLRGEPTSRGTRIIGASKSKLLHYGNGGGLHYGFIEDDLVYVALSWPLQESQMSDVIRRLLA